MRVYTEHQLSNEIIWNANLMQQGNFINVFLARHVSGTYGHHLEHQTLSCSIWFSAPSFWMGGGLESRCVGRVCAKRARNTLIKLPCCIKLAFKIISWGRCKVKQPSNQLSNLWSVCFIPNRTFIFSATGFRRSKTNGSRSVSEIQDDFLFLQYEQINRKKIRGQTCRASRLGDWYPGFVLEGPRKDRKYFLRSVVISLSPLGQYKDNFSN